MLADIEFQQNQQITGVFRVHKPVVRTVRNHTQYISCMLCDRSGQIPAYAWLDRYNGIPLANRALVAVSGVTRWFADRWQLDLSMTELVQSRNDNPLDFLLEDYFAVQSCIARLESTVNYFQISALRDFLINILRDDRITLPLLSLPASFKHHHAYPGGLLEHSLECAEFVQHATIWQDQAQRELAVCAALLHDIGKTRTLDRVNGGMIGALLGHDLLTLELLAKPLALLEQSWPDGATAMRYLLSWKLQHHSNRQPMMTIAEIVQAADRVSSGMHNESVLFGEVPAWKKLVANDRGKFWRPETAIAYVA